MIPWRTGRNHASSPPRSRARRRDRLTPQKLQVVRPAGGGTSPQIATQLFVSPRAVEHHRYRSLPKLGVRSRRALSTVDVG
ncbi:helix-turn-helix transcriptional regulator [Actinosynnema sp. NPDC047251]|uniref:helix-turn-helix domain-containing protein n=1 Tax=Saccharothrix espanaensis TaxID=103731 RepID=UPI0018D444C9|nr:helix-turn-helix transcriptional regulator [Saccharothrix espanaensis]